MARIFSHLQDRIRWLLGREPSVVWGSEAAGQLGPGSPLSASRTKILEHALKCTFPRARTISALRSYRGHRRNDDRYILLTDIVEDGRPRRHVVKVGLGEQAETIRAECKTWQQCWPKMVRHDPVLMRLEPGYDRPDLATLIYGDAQQYIFPTIRHDQTAPRPLQEAVLSCVLTGTPSVTSVCELLFQLYERLACLLYHDAREEPVCSAPAGPHFSMPRVWDALQHWDEQEGPRRMGSDRYRMAWAVRCRNDFATEAESRYLDPVKYLHFLKRFTTWRVPRREITGRREDTGTVDLAATDSRKGPAEDFIPRCLRGRSHGDLHGLNVLVGEIDGRVLWPAVFDYEHVRDDNWIGWDFVKMETELKIRALRQIFPEDFPDQYANQVQEFEWDLNLWTRDCLDRMSWPRVGALPGKAPPEQRHAAAGPGPNAISRETSVTLALAGHEYQLARLRAIVLEIRQRAAHILGVRHGRTTSWWREYLFLLMCYGVCCVRFPNLDALQLMAAYKSANVAACWLDTQFLIPGAPAPISSLQLERSTHGA